MGEQPCKGELQHCERPLLTGQLPFLPRGGNLTLLHFLLGLKTAADDELVAELVVNILKVCPDLLNKYFKEVTFSFLPRVKATWQNNIKLLNKVTFRVMTGGRKAGRVSADVLAQKALQ